MIATLLMAFRPKDKMVIPYLLEQAEMGLEILESLQREKAVEESTLCQGDLNRGENTSVTQDTPTTH